MAAVIGAPEVMQAAQDTFISSTYWTESIGPAAAIATIKKMRDFNVQSHLRSIGGRAKDILECAARRYDINLSCNGPLSMSFFSFNYGASSNAVRTLFTQEMLDRGILAANRFYPSFAHRDDHLDGYDKAVNEVFLIIQQALEQGTVLSRLRGPVAHSGFQRLN
jgi:glutamate-1-semialdehyde aminotransferase